MSRDEIEAFFLDGDGPEFEAIQLAERDADALGLASMALIEAGHGPMVMLEDLVFVVRKIREA